MTLVKHAVACTSSTLRQMQARPREVHVGIFRWKQPSRRSRTSRCGAACALPRSHPDWQRHTPRSLGERLKRRAKPCVTMCTGQISALRSSSANLAGKSSTPLRTFHTSYTRASCVIPHSCVFCISQAGIDCDGVHKFDPLGSLSATRGAWRCLRCQ